MNEADRFLKEQQTGDPQVRGSSSFNRDQRAGSDTFRTEGPWAKNGTAHPEDAQFAWGKNASDTTSAPAHACPETPSSGPRTEQRVVPFGEACRRFWERWTFDGRASRSEYWWAFLMTFLCNIGFGILGVFVLPVATALQILFAVIVLLPQTAIMGRRLHDIGQPAHTAVIACCLGVAYNVCLYAVPNMAGFVLIPLMLVGLFLFAVALMPSKPQPNAYGPVPNVFNLD